jgi:DNA-binding transcriptional LysR family regulator
MADPYREDAAMELRHLRYFVAVADEPHFGRAARRLGMSQPPLSLTVRQLEEELGVKLLDRTNKRVSLTPAGVVLHTEAQHVLAQAEQAGQLARKIGAGRVGHLRVGFTGSMLYRGLPAILAAFQARHPGVEVVLKECNSAEQVDALQHARLDVGFIHGVRSVEGLDGLEFVAEPFMCCLPVGHRLARAPRVALARLRAEPFVLFSRDVSPRYYDLVLTVCEQAGFTPSVRHEVRHWLTVVALVAQRMGVALVPAALATSRMPGVRFVHLGDASARSVTSCVWPKDRSVPGLRGFIECVRARATRRGPNDGVEP